MESSLKKTIFYALLFFSSAILANPDQFKIDITNQGNTNCVLQQKTILSGYVSDRSEVPMMLRPDETGTFFMRSGTAHPIGNGMLLITPSSIKDKMLLFTYHCADNQEATLFANISPFQDSFFNSPQISTFVKPENMQVETRTIVLDSLQVHWILKNNQHNGVSK
ncbi:MAG: hypothetical protein NXI01_04530 [Gammaproteobacteria bacterium]|nr:hypothetical protein [Gammaproteobacteria bacterium]